MSLFEECHVLYNKNKKNKEIRKENVKFQPITDTVPVAFCKFIIVDISSFGNNVSKN